MNKRIRLPKPIHRAFDPADGRLFMMSDPFIAIQAETFGAKARICVHCEFEDGTGGVIDFEYAFFDFREGVFRFEFWSCQQIWPIKAIKLSDDIKHLVLGIGGYSE